MEQIDIWKQKLLDLGLRNKLLNYKAGGRTGLNILLPKFGELYKKLVKQEKTLTFDKVVYETRCRLVDDNDENLNLTEERVARVVPGDIQTDREAENLEKTLKALKDRARIAVEEQGVNILYMAFGFLEWFEKGSSSERFLAPLVLVPVTIYKENILSAYKLHLHEDEILFNPTLRYKLEHEMGIVLPDFDEDEDIEAYFENLQNHPQITEFSVVQKCGLGLFSFLKMNMYFDLEKNKDRIARNPILSAMIEKRPFVSPDVADVTADYQVVDTDSSQQEALQYAMLGRSFILQGPPGTGKSQTITNIIASALAVGKKVLFVAEKAAALNVVYNRLSNAGLDESCLFLHSYKANKKEVLKQLNKTLNSPKIRVNEQAYQKLKELEVCTNHLDDYVRELHEKIKPLGMSIFEVIGKLLTLQELPDISFSVAGVFGKEADKVTNDELAGKLQILEQLRISGGRLSCSFRNNVWRYANIESLSLTFRQELASFYSNTAEKVRNLEAAVRDCTAYYDIKVASGECTVETVSEIIRLLHITPIEQKPLVDFTVWENENLDEKKELVEKISRNFALQSTLNERLHQKYDIKIKNVDVAMLSDGLNALKKLQAKPFGDDKAFWHIEQMKDYCNLFDKVTQNAQEALEIAKAYGMDTLEIADFDFIKEVFTFCAQKIQPSWLCPLHHFTSSIAKITELESLYKTEENLRGELTAFFRDEIFEMETNAFGRELRQIKNSFTAVFSKSYRLLRKAFVDSTKPGVYFKASFENITRMFSLLESWQACNKEIKTKEELAGKFLGEEFYQRETAWEDIKKNAADFQRISTQFESKYFISLYKAITFDREKLMKAASFFTLIQKFIPLTQEFCKSSLARVTYYELMSTAQETVLQLKKFIVAAEQIKEYSQASTFVPEEILSDLSDIEKLQKLEEEAASLDKTLKTELQNLYELDKTDWEKVREYLAWFENIQSFAELDCRKVVLSLYDGQTLDTKNVLSLENTLNGVLPDYEKIVQMFDSRRNWENMGLSRVYSDMQSCADNIHLLEEWIDYNNARKSCCDSGLESYIDMIELSGREKAFDESKKNFLLIKEIFYKRFYNEWLDCVLADNSEVSGFRRKKYEALLEEFCALDLRQFSITQAKIKEKLSMQIPDFADIVCAGSELTILRREAEKKTRIMPLRLLFEKIPNLISLLKPCMMMSPLSVSLFLQSDSYEFDLVVFDEASQVRTEDAVGAICRAKQVIIAGDKEQLPPTDFFTATVETDEYDDEYEGSFESVLEQMSSVLGQKMLKWHYRSRNESLIAFSNKEIYNSQLVTFASANAGRTDTGVEFVYVENGVYERGTTRENINEALKVAQLVLRHIRLTPDKSLGVITFSATQQAAIERIILQLRRDNPQIAYFFDEQRPAAFFVKNLENVQGDERDTIIFSIGYAKDSKGNMSMNFGPLSREGGYRRLNVAITRAKYNLKLVSSILPEDIKVKQNDSDTFPGGVAMLKSYMEFVIAMKNASLTPRDISKQEISDFEEMIYRLLTDCGYNVVQRPGFSSFRIDLAVVNEAGDFVLGIMCDGQMYKSAGNVRERERLRNTILEEMGWKIYKVWSYEWLKNPVGCKDELIEAVEEALQNKTDIPTQTDETKTEIDFEIFKTLQVKNVGFEEYREADIFQVKRREDEKNNDFISRVASYVIEKEAPISLETLCIRLAVLLGYKKLCPGLQNSVENILNEKSDMFVQKDGFFIHKDTEISARKAGSRTINQIASEELEKCVLTAVKSSVGISADSLSLYTSKLMGFSRITPTIFKVLEKIRDDLVKKNQLKIDGTKVRLAD